MERKHSAIGTTRRQALQFGASALGGAILSPFVLRGAGAQSPLAGKTLGLTVYFADTEWTRIQRESVLKTAERFGFKVLVSDATRRPAKQISDIEDMITRRVDCLLVSTYASEAIAPAIQQVNKAGIPIIVLSSAIQGDVKWDVHLSIDSLSSGRASGEYFVKRLKGQGNVIEIDGSPGSTVNQDRGKGFHDVVDKVPGIKVVGKIMADYDRAKALKGMEDMLQAHAKIDAVYSHSEDMALGAIQAIKEAGRAKQMFVTGYDGVATETLATIYSGDLEMVMSYYPFGVEAVEAAARVLQKKPIPNVVKFDAPMISKANILDYYDPETKKAKIAPSRLTALNLPG